MSNEAAVLSRGWVKLFDEEEYQGGDDHALFLDLNSYPVGAMHIFGNDPRGQTMRGRPESAQWSIAPGYIVVIYQHIDGRGSQLVLLGDGGQPDLHVHDADNKMQAFRIVKP